MDSFNLHRRHVINNRHHQDREEFCTVVTAQLNLSRRNPLFIEHVFMVEIRLVPFSVHLRWLLGLSSSIIK
ncbi:hypothetical protein V1477_001704 [Vespula maculifrons]|uniref:Uncharacterized protein n=1 Tax=Vespula maculifrons TaxID=7453 RepID=A0ABD2CYJ0_VESMC